MEDYEVGDMVVKINARDGDEVQDGTGGVVNKIWLGAIPGFFVSWETNRTFFYTTERAKELLNFQPDTTKKDF